MVVETRQTPRYRARLQGQGLGSQLVEKVLVPVVEGVEGVLRNSPGSSHPPGMRTLLGRSTAIRDERRFPSFPSDKKRSLRTRAVGKKV